MDDEAQKLSDMEYHKQRGSRRDLARKIGAVEFMAQNVEPILKLRSSTLRAGRVAGPRGVHGDPQGVPACLGRGRGGAATGNEMLLAQKVLDDVVQERVDGCSTILNRTHEAAAAARRRRRRRRRSRNQRQRTTNAVAFVLRPVAVLGVLAVDLGDVRGDGVGRHAAAARTAYYAGARAVTCMAQGWGSGVVADRHLLEEARFSSFSALVTLLPP